MLFSVVISVYNAECTIRKCLDSVLNQTFSNFEVIVINDGSTDNTRKILDEYSIKDSRIKVFNFSNSGVGISRRKGVNLAKGQYVLFVDSDDFINDELLQRLYSTISSVPELDIIRYQSNIINDKKNKNHERYNYFDSSNPLSGLETLKIWSVSQKKYAVYWLFCFKRSLFNQTLPIPNLKCYEDVAFIPLLIATANCVTSIDYVGYNYCYDNCSSLTHSKTYSAERSRAYDFFAAYDFAIQNFIKLDNVTSSDIEFFIADYNRRLIGKFNSLEPNLQQEFRQMLDLRTKFKR